MKLMTNAVAVLTLLWLACPQAVAYAQDPEPAPAPAPVAVPRAERPERSEPAQRREPAERPAPAQRQDRGEERAMPRERSERLEIRETESRSPRAVDRVGGAEEGSRMRVRERVAEPSSSGAVSAIDSDPQAQERGGSRRPTSGGGSSSGGSGSGGGTSAGGGGGSTRDRAVARTNPPRDRDVNTQRVYVYPDYWAYDRYSRGYGYDGFGIGYLSYSPWGWTPSFYGSPYGYGYGYGQGYGYGRGDDEEGAVRIKVKPRDAEVFVDGYFAGYVDDFDGAFQSLRLDRGAYTIEVRKPGFETLSFNVRVQRDRTVTLRREMQER